VLTAAESVAAILRYLAANTLSHRQTIGIFIFLEMHRKVYRKIKGLED